MKNIGGTGAFIAATGGTANYAYKLYKGEKFSFFRFVLHLVIAAFVGWICESVGLPGAAIAMAGASSLRIMELIDTKFADIVFNKIK